MPSFGRTDNGTATQAYSSDRKIVSKAGPSTSGTITDGVVRMFAASAVAVPCRMVVYSDVAGEPSALLAVSNDTTFTSTAEIAVPFIFSGVNQINVTALTSYWIGVQYDYTSATVSVSRTTTAGIVRSNNDSFSDGASNPFGATATTAGPIDAYINYTEAAPPSATGNMFAMFN